MRISTDASMISSLISAFYQTTLQNAAQTSSSYAGSLYGVTSQAADGDFGPAALLSAAFGQSTQSVSDRITSGDYTFLANLALQPPPQLTPQVSDEQQKQEQDTVKQAVVLRLNERYDEARDLLETLLDRNPQNALAVHAMGALELDQGNYEKAEQYFQRAHYLSPKAGFDSDAANARILQEGDEYVLEQAERMSQRSDTRDAATRLLVALTDRSPSDAVARSLLAENLIRAGDGAQGLAQYQLAVSSADRIQLQQLEAKLASLVEAAPAAAYLRNLLGQTQLRLGRNEEAAATLALASKLSNADPLYLADEALAQVALGRDALDVGDLSGAMSAFNAAYGLDPTGDEVKVGLAQGYMARGEWLARMGDLSGAVEELTTAKSKLGAVENDEMRADLAAAFYRVGKRLETGRLQSGDEVGDEIIAFQAAYDLEPENRTYRNKLAETRNTIGDEYLAAGNYKDAAYSYQKAFEVNPYLDAYKQSAIGAFLLWGDDRRDAHDHLSAITAYQAAYDLDKDNETSKFSLAEAFNTRGLFYRSLGGDFYGMAADDFRAALKLYPDNADYQDNYDSVTNPWD